MQRVAVWQRVAFRLRRAVRSWFRDDGSMLSAALSYYMAISFFPLLLVLIAGLGLLMRHTGWGQNAQRKLLEFIAEQTTTHLAGQIAELLAQVEHRAPVSGPLGIVILLFTAITIFAQFDRAFDRIWKVDAAPPRGFRRVVVNVLTYRLKAFVMLLAVGLLIVVTFLAGLAVSTLAVYGELLIDDHRLWRVAQTATNFALNGLLFTLLYKTLPKAEVRWAEAAQGAIVAAVVWQLGSQILALVLGNAFGAYGLVGSFLAVLLWVYYAAAVLLLGAEYVRVLFEERGEA